MGMLSLNRSPTPSAYLLVFRFGSISFVWREANLAGRGRTCASGAASLYTKEVLCAPGAPLCLSTVSCAFGYDDA